MTDMTSGFARIIHGGNEPLPEIRVVAVVEFNKEPVGMVLNRMPRFRYERTNGGIIAHDGPFTDALTGPEGSRAFAGRTIRFPMLDGSILVSKGAYWQSGVKGKVGATYSTIENLKRCYVFTGGACIAPEDRSELIGQYDGPVYRYYDYEKVITCDDFRVESWRCKARFEKTKRRMQDRIKLLDWKAKQLERLLDGKEIQFNPRAAR